MIEIKHRHNGTILHTVDADTLAGADMRGAYLSGAYLTGAAIVLYGFTWFIQIRCITNIMSTV